MDNFNEPTRNLNGDIPITEIFRPVNTNLTITDKYGETWRQETALGFRRVSDNYFWPCDPRNNDNFMGVYPPTISDIKKQRRLN